MKEKLPEINENMELEKEAGYSRSLNWIVPVWLKVIVAILPLGWAGVFIRALLVDQSLLLGLHRENIILFAFVLFVLSTLLAVALWFYSDSVFSRLFYWLLCLLKDHICVLALLGILYLLTIRAPVISLRGGVLYILLFVVFGIGFLVKPAGLDDVPHPTLEPVFNSFKRIISKIGSGSTVLWASFAVILPVVIALFIIYVVIGSRLSDYGPFSFWNDEVAYWVWLRSFVHAGLNSGYNSPNELLPLLDFSRYGEASPFYLYVYGTIGRLVGWFPALPIGINFLVISLSLFLFVRFVKLDVWQIIFLCLVVAFTWPISLYLPMTTHETLNQAIGIILTIVFIKLLDQRSKIPLKLRWSFVLFVYFATFVRLSWGLLLIPVLFYCLDGSLLKRGILSVILGFGLYVSVVIIMSYLLPPLNNSILDTFKGGLVDGPRIFIEKLRLQVYYMFKFREFNPNIGVSFQMLLVMGWSIARLFRLLRSRLSLNSISNDFSAFDFYNMMSLFFAGFLFYLQEGFYRTFAPVMLIVYLLQVFRRDYRHLSALLMINILFFSSYMNFYAHIGDFQIIKADYTRGFSEEDQIQSEIGKFIVYDPDADDPWCNTLLIPLDYYDSRLMLIPPGIGVSYILQPSTFRLPIKSRYVLFDPETYATYKDRVNFEHLASLWIGELYVNLDVNCFGPRDLLQD